jgi:hypothetical protein
VAVAKPKGTWLDVALHSLLEQHATEVSRQASGDVGGDVARTGVNQDDRHDRRKAYRYPLLLPAIVRTAEQKSWTARSKDVSAKGAYLLLDSDADLHPGTELELTLTLTLPKEITSGTEVLVCAYGRAVRVDKSAERGTGPMGLGIAFKTRDFIRSESPRGADERLPIAPTESKPQKHR